MARDGADQSVIAKRQGLQAFPLTRYRNLNGLQGASIVNREANVFDPDAIMIDATGGVEKPNMAVVSPGILARLRSLLNSANASNISLKDYLEAAYEVTFHAEQTMTQAGPGSSNAMLLYRKDPQRVRVAMPLFLSPLTIQPVGLAFKCPMESRFGGVILPRPLSILRLDGI